ncbi:MAG: hypothetical protein NXI31_24620 [bacterium]|nr:hypothetical protein [bacterium]
MIRLVVLACGLLLAACTGVTGRRPPGRFEGLPWTAAPVDRTVMHARRLGERGDDDAALELLADVLRRAPRHVDANRVRQDILRRRGRRGLLIHELEAMLTVDSADPLALYLRGRVAFSRQEKLRWFEAAAAAAPGWIWPWLGYAHTLAQTDLERGQVLFDRLYRATASHPLIALAFTPTLLRRGQLQAAADVFRELADDPRVPGLGATGLARVLLTLDDRDGAWRALLEALRERPFDDRVQRLVGSWIDGGASSDQLAELFDVLRVRPGALADFGQGAGVMPLVRLYERQRQPHAALALLAAAGSNARTPELRRTERRLRLGIGDVAGFLAIVREDVPRDLVAGEANQLRGRWLTLLDGPWMTGDPLETVAQSVALLDAMLRAGFVFEAEQLADLASRRWPEATAIGERLHEARLELAFEAGMRRLLYRGYRDEDTATLDEVAERVRELGQRIFDRDVVGQIESFRVPLVGDLLDPFRGLLMAHLAHYNRHLVLGRRAGGVAEGMLLTRLAVTELADDAALPLPGRCYEVLACDRDVRAFQGVVGGDIAGVALLNHYLVDYDAVREWAGAIVERRAIARADGLALVRDPLPEQQGFDPLDVAHRLAVLSPVEDIALDVAVLDTIRHHERQHLVDSFYYLPIEYNLGRSFGLIWQFGLSPALIEGEMERRAELASLAVSPHTALVLSHIVDFLGEPGAESPHHRGFGALARQLSRRFEALGVPAVDAMPSRWHRLDFALVRRAARELLAELPTPGRASGS